ncbi:MULTISPECIES: aldo/keto reductase [Prochlorococcus]|uniref:Predicted oxidoreductase n=1 Tax=Prochlorococcus marinus (strain SARG / CCMP1375 / SS120) TaxID=167539 RepID=Q7VBA5_PROMA|nr:MULTISPECIES: aldo/keto reductase [Prochlorococcus]AAQ00237.1 Predicted oxidoreductase [Prochlorococcus marinus subsp. marinus str. CCMP1375]KGG14038.1 hypothetical protein EV04_0523 [Prochlorococcus marinus str. LG]KGG19170.1 hypothetical protein EV08_1657 [Prochlorococcus marinus str. SS2]KGG23289.1 hypothetical protein EV09_0913 [Prochlorococcus marinus str. SS35]KGG32476.1 hypothetical protein EV10_1591 [Prochlorococcus marinus str. SS51]
MIKIGFGTWAWGNKFLWGYLPEKDDELLEKTFKIAINNGLNLIDTADSYGTGSLNGRSEKLLGKYLSDLSPTRRKSIVIATKLAPYPWRLGKEALTKAFHASKNRLKGKLDRIQLHWSTSRYAPWQEVQLIDCLGSIYEQGLISEIGVSNMGPLRLRWIYDRLKKRGIPLKSLQIQFSLLSPQQKRNYQIKEVCKELNIQLLAYSPLALGVLSISPSEKKVPETFLRQRIFNRLIPSSIDLRKGLHKIANDRGVSQTQVALNWCRSHGSIPIPGIRTPNQALDISEACKWELNKKEKLLLDELSIESKQRMPANPFQSN